MLRFITMNLKDYKYLDASDRYDRLEFLISLEKPRCEGQLVVVRAGQGQVSRCKGPLG